MGNAEGGLRTTDQLEGEMRIAESWEAEMGSEAASLRGDLLWERGLSGNKRWVRDCRELFAAEANMIRELARLRYS